MFEGRVGLGGCDGYKLQIKMTFGPEIQKGKFYRCDQITLFMYKESCRHRSLKEYSFTVTLLTLECVTVFVDIGINIVYVPCVLTVLK